MGMMGATFESGRRASPQAELYRDRHAKCAGGLPKFIYNSAFNFIHNQIQTRNCWIICKLKHLFKQKI